jgi:uncharacterized damage-inducible protein DinB
MNVYPSLINRLKTQHESIPIIIARLDETSLELNPVPNKWSIKDNIAHLARYQPLFIDRINQILDHDSPVFERYNADKDPEFVTWQNWETGDLLRQLFSDREIISTLITELHPEQLSRTGIHPKYGKMNILEWAEFFLLHEAHHIFTIFQLVRSGKEKN